MDTNDIVKQSAHQAQQIAEGAALNVAFRSEPGQVILGAMLDRFADVLERLVLDPLSDEQVLVVYHEMKGMIALGESLGDSIRQATQAVARSTMQDKLRQTQKRRSDEGA